MGFQKLLIDKAIKLLIIIISTVFKIFKNRFSTDHPDIKFAAQYFPLDT